MKQIEDMMQKYLVKDAPVQIPTGGRKLIAQWAPWISLVVGLLSLLSALSLWHFANRANEIIGYANEFGRAYGVQTQVESISFFVYVSIIFIVIQGVLMVVAFKGLLDKNKSKGWNLLLYSMFASIAYTFFSLFVDHYRSVGSSLFGIIGIVIGLYILAQIRDQYKDSSSPSPKSTNKK